MDPETPVSPGSEDGAASPPSGDPGASFDAALDSYLAADATPPPDAADATPADPDAPEEDEEGARTEPAGAAPAAKAPPKLSPRELKLQQERDAAVERATEWYEHHQQRERAEAEAHEDGLYRQAVEGAQAAVKAARAETRQKAQRIYDPDERADWIAEQDDHIAGWYDGRIAEIHHIREGRVRAAAQATVAHMGRAPFAVHLIGQKGSGLTMEDLPRLVAPLPDGHPADGHAIAARAQQFKQARKESQYESRIKALEAQLARGALKGSGASVVPGSGSRGAGAGKGFADLKDDELTLDMAFGG